LSLRPATRQEALKVGLGDRAARARDDLDRPATGLSEPRKADLELLEAVLAEVAVRGAAAVECLGAQWLTATVRQPPRPLYRALTATARPSAL
jgi:hypothetical protein